MNELQSLREQAESACRELDEHRALCLGFIGTPVLPRHYRSDVRRELKETISKLIGARENSFQLDEDSLDFLTDCRERQKYTDRVDVYFQKDKERLAALFEERRRVIQQAIDDFNTFVEERISLLSEIDHQVADMVNPAVDEFMARQEQLERNLQECEDKRRSYQVKEITPVLRQLLTSEQEVKWLDCWRDIPHAPGVYLLIEDTELVYVGESEDIRKRVTPGGHGVYQFPQHLIGIIVTNGIKERKLLERRLIQSLQPSRNVAYSIDPRQITFW